MAILQHPAEVGQEFIARASRVGFVDNTLAVVRDAIATSVEHWDAADWVARVAAEVPPSFSTLVKQLSVAPIPSREDKLGAYCRSVTIDLIDRDLLRQKKDLMGISQRTEAADDPAKYGEIQRELVRVESERRALRNE
jgi:DNA primase